MKRRIACYLAWGTGVEAAVAALSLGFGTRQAKSRLFCSKQQWLVFYRRRRPRESDELP
jgi:hypothetical protein